VTAGIGKMSKTIVVVTICVVATLSCFGQAPQAPASSDASYEEFPELKASEILKPEYVKGSHYTVRENIATGSGVNQFIIDSDFGVFDADGNAMLVRREKEIYAIARLTEVSRTDQFKDSLSNAAKGTYNAAKRIVTDPGTTLSNVPKGVSKFMGKAGQSIRNIGKKKEDNGQRDSNVEKMTGVGKSKRKIAVSMGIDPYSTNSVLQKQLEDVAWASWAGGFLFSAGTFPISGPVGAGLTVTNVSDSLNKAVEEKPPTDLRAMNRDGLRKIGAGERDTELLLNNSAFTLTDQTAFVLNLKSLDGVANRGAFVRAAADRSDSESDALFCVQTSALMGQIHTSSHPLAHIVMMGDLPVCVAKDGTLIVALQWDYAAWTAKAAAFVDDVQKLANEPGQNKHVLIAISGQMSPRLKQELQSRGIAAQDHMNPGPLQ
jgi:hypothetical protein